MNNSRTLLAADPGKVGAMRKQRVDQGVFAISRPGMNDEPGRLIEDEEIVVFEKYLERDCFRLLRLDLHDRWLDQLDLIIGSNQLAWSGRFSIESDRTVTDQCL